MSELQIGLLAIGAVVVAAVLLYNRVQESRARRHAEGSFRSGHDDVLMNSHATPVSPGDARQGAPRAGETSPEPQRHALQHAHHDESLQPDAAIDYIIEISAGRPVARADFREQWNAIERRHSRRAVLAASPGDMIWRAGLQLVSRDGAIGEADLIEFRSAVETLAASVSASVAAPEMRSAVDAARELDEFCAESDIQVVVHLNGGPFAATKVRAAAESGGLALESDGKFVMRDGGGRLLYTLGTRDGSVFPAAAADVSTEALTLSFDVTRAPDTRRTFESMARLANQLASTLGGNIVDDNGRALDERALAAIATQLDSVRTRLEARGISPGSPTALRLFS